jgi:Ser-tRNA(Ala) deacylase AlaX
VWNLIKFGNLKENVAESKKEGKFEIENYKENNTSSKEEGAEEIMEKIRIFIEKMMQEEEQIYEGKVKFKIEVIMERRKKYRLLES